MNSCNDQKEIRPLEVKFIDFQSARFASLATDLVLFLFTSVRVSHMNDTSCFSYKKYSDYILFILYSISYCIVNLLQTFIEIIFNFSQFWQTLFSKFMPYFCRLSGKSWCQLRKNKCAGLTSDQNWSFNWMPNFLIQS